MPTNPQPAAYLRKSKEGWATRAVVIVSEPRRPGKWSPTHNTGV